MSQEVLQALLKFKDELLIVAHQLNEGEGPDTIDRETINAALLEFIADFMK